jgi:hypothetical protein
MNYKYYTKIINRLGINVIKQQKNIIILYKSLITRLINNNKKIPWFMQVLIIKESIYFYYLEIGFKNH